MGCKKTYWCDLCGENLDKPEESFGLYFTNYYTFTLGGYGSTDGKHICFSCTSQLKKHLNKPEIEKYLGEV